MEIEWCVAEFHCFKKEGVKKAIDLKGGIPSIIGTYSRFTLTRKVGFQKPIFKAINEMLVGKHQIKSITFLLYHSVGKSKSLNVFSPKIKLSKLTEP